MAIKLSFFLQFDFQSVAHNSLINGKTEVPQRTQHNLNDLINPRRLDITRQKYLHVLVPGRIARSAKFDLRE